MPQEHPKSAPRAPQESPREPKRHPQDAQEHPKAPKRHPKATKRHPRKRRERRWLCRLCRLQLATPLVSVSVWVALGCSGCFGCFGCLGLKIDRCSWPWACFVNCIRCSRSWVRFSRTHSSLSVFSCSGFEPCVGSFTWGNAGVYMGEHGSSLNIYMGGSSRLHGGSLLGHFGAVLGGLGSLLGRSWVALGRSWVALGPSLAGVGMSWGLLCRTYSLQSAMGLL